MSASVLYMWMSLDGYLAGPNEEPGNPVGDGFDRLHDWFVTPDGEFGRPAGPGGQLWDEMHATGAVLSGDRHAGGHTHPLPRPSLSRSTSGDSSAVPGTVEAVYMSGRAEELTGSELELGIELFDRMSQEEIARAWGLGDVQPPSHSSVSIARRLASTSSSFAAETQSAGRASTAASR